MLITIPRVEGSPAPTFQWFRNGFPLPGETGATYAATHIDASHMGTYSCELKNVAGKFIWHEVAVSVT
jgi:hypothetical protein